MGIFVFPLVSAICALSFRNVIFSAGLGADTSSKCDLGTPAFQTFGELCVPVMAFLAPADLFLKPDSVSWPYFQYSMVIFAPLYLLIQVEAVRNNRPLILSAPLIIGTVLAALTAGLIMPLYCFAFVLSGSASLQIWSTEYDDEFAVNRKDAEAVAFGVIVGYVMPSIALAVFHDLLTFVLWFGFQGYMSALQTTWRIGRSDTPQVDTTIVKGLYALTFVVTSITHIVHVLSRIHDIQLLKGFFLPPLSALEPSPTLSPTWDLDLFQWDVVLSLLAVMVATLWFAKDGKQRSMLLIWHVAATMTVGPSASVCGALLWREICLTKALEGPKEKQKTFLNASVALHGVTSHDSSL